MLGRILLPLLLALPSFGAGDAERLRLHGAQGVNFWKLREAANRKLGSPSFVVQDDSGFSNTPSDPAVSKRFPTHTFQQPLDHFDNTSDATFEQRYWINTRHYKPGTGAPVIVIDGGETSGEDRIPFLDTGIADILAKATGGVGVVLEHRYYGASVGVKNFTTDSLRWLNNEQALEDSANFMRNVKFKGIDEDLTAPNTAWIYYGGSYAGARAAHMKILYPDIVFGAIASSAVTHAALINWEYMDVIRLAADPKCSANLVRSITVIDSLLKVPRLRNPLKALFDLSGLENDQDFVSVLEWPLGSWQGRNWDPDVGSTDFDYFCAVLNGNAPSLNDVHHDITLPGGLTVNVAVLNYAKYVKENIVSLCPTDSGVTVEECFGTNDDERYQATDLDQTWRLWVFQYCTQWGYLTTAPPNRHHPTIISRLLDVDYAHKICTQAFPPGKFFTVPQLPNVTAVNALGDFDIAADRLAFIDGEVDPWRPYTPNSQYYASPRPDTVLRPFKVIPGGVHHWDENGLAKSTAEPQEIRAIHKEMVSFVRAWLKDFRKPSATGT
ncbi:peptidase S28 [Auriscalpium vulgare]|uniref:Peptidase S28 n=1 Tax=Auriscalpium vulgare TaxID=40419 RepID=A0ACB8RBT6_9AGAM|nr:peptidase S28 [Auriscalpium vulgare]